MARHIILSKGSYGDVTVGWDEADDDKVLPTIQQMIDQKWLFFILETDGTKQPITAIDQVSDRSIVVPNELLEELHQSGVLSVGARIVETATNTGEIARTPEAVAAADTIATPPASGG